MMEFVIAQQKGDRVSIEREGQFWKVIVSKDGKAINHYLADSQGVAIGIARKQMERLE